ncbi:MAG: NAD-dependent dehydratase [Acidobacteria bacterium]|nr:MAG: NAD-dependent dehydratase [Acidobacteriota bacterium]
MKIAITGVSGYLGQLLLKHLAEDDSVTEIVGIDMVEPGYSPPNLRFHRADIRDPELAAFLDGVAVLVHLAFVFNPIHDENLMSDINVNGTLNVFSAAAEAGVSQVVYASSMAVYGAHSDNDYPLTEESPLRANADFSYALHKLEAERRIAVWREENPDIKVALLRMAIVMGAGAENFVSRSLEAPRLLSVAGYAPPLQFLHQDDAVAAIRFAIDHSIDGVYNVSADGELSRDEFLAIIGKKDLALPEPAAFPAAKIAWKLGVSEAPAGELRFLMHRWVVSNEKFKEAGFAPLHTNREALVETVEANRGWVSLGTARIAEDRYERLLRTSIVFALLALLLVLLGMRDSGE